MASTSRETARVAAEVEPSLQLAALSRLHTIPQRAALRAALQAALRTALRAALQAAPQARVVAKLEAVLVGYVEAVQMRMLNRTANLVRRPNDLFLDGPISLTRIKISKVDPLTVLLLPHQC